MSDIFFVADTHFGHTNILKYDKRPFSSIEDHDEWLIDAWNRKVRPSDLVYHLGDVALYRNADDYFQLLSRLNGRIYLIVGNHDKGLLARKEARAQFENIEQIRVLKYRGKGLVDPKGKLYLTLCHYPMLRWYRSHWPDSWLLFGHEHRTLGEFDPAAWHIVNSQAMFDVGVCKDCGWAPVALEELRQEMSTHIYAGNVQPTGHQQERG